MHLVGFIIRKTTLYITSVSANTLPHPQDKFGVHLCNTAIALRQLKGLHRVSDTNRLLGCADARHDTQVSLNYQQPLYKSVSPVA